MTQAIIDQEKASGVLTSAIEAAKHSPYKSQHPKAKEISEVMLGRHLTYRYILLTNLLAKATNPHANALALQAGADLPGAFDARSLCHKVVVDSDRDPNKLSGKLGRSNEPFLNKPARYPALSLDNAVRRGYDRAILEKCIDVLGGLRDDTDALQALTDAVHFTMKREALVAQATQVEGSAALHKILTRFVRAAIAQSCEGESCALVTGLAFYILGRSVEKAFEVKVHPVNQAGSSSNEVLDVDVRVKGALTFTAEVKDKHFTANDVSHAARKAADAGLKSFFFICGPRSQGANAGTEYVEKEANERQMRVSFVDVEQFFGTCLGLAPNETSAEEIWTFIDNAMMTARIKDATQGHVLGAARYAGLVTGED